MSKIQPVVTRWKNTIRKEKTYDVLSIQRESDDDTKNTRKKQHLQINKKKKRNTCGYRGACIVSKEDWTEGRGFNESIK